MVNETLVFETLSRNERTKLTNVDELKQVGWADRLLANILTPPDINPLIVLHRNVKRSTKDLSILHLPALASILLTRPSIIPLLPNPKAMLTLDIMTLPSVGLTISMELFVIPIIPPYLCVRLRFTSITLNFGIPPVIPSEVPLPHPFDTIKVLRLVRNNLTIRLGPLPLWTIPTYPCVALLTLLNCSFRYRPLDNYVGTVGATTFSIITPILLCLNI